MAWRHLSIAAALTLVSLVPVAPATATCTDLDPPNDCRENAIELTSRNVLFTVSNVRADVEPGEPLPADMGNTVWYKWTAFRASAGSFSVRHSNHQAGHAVYELQPDGSLLLLDAASGWTSMPWSSFSCAAGKTYFLQLGGEEGQTGTVNVDGSVCQLAAEAPKAPTLGAAPGPERGEIQLSYSVSDDGGSPITGRVIESSTGTCSTFSEIRPNDPTTSPADRGLTEGVYHCYRVAVENAVGRSPWSNLASSVPRGVPVAPPLFGAASKTTGTISLGWWPVTATGGEPLTHYNLYVAESAAGPFTLLAEPTGTSHVETGLAPGTTRHYRLTAESALGEGAAATASATAIGPPTAPRSVEASPSGLLSVRVEWAPPADNGGSAITEYKVYRAAKGGDLSLIARVPGSARSYVDNPTWNRPHEYAVVATNLAGSSPFSDRACGASLLAPPVLLERC